MAAPSQLKRCSICVVLFLSFGASAFAQPRFEVAAIHPSNSGATILGGGPGTIEPNRLVYQNAPLASIIAKAFGVRDFQVEGPGWLKNVKYNILANLPPGTTRADIPLMVQDLLQERFHIELHRDKGEFPAYRLSLKRKAQTSGVRAAND